MRREQIAQHAVELDAELLVVGRGAAITAASAARSSVAGGAFLASSASTIAVKWRTMRLHGTETPARCTRVDELVVVLAVRRLAQRGVEPGELRLVEEAPTRRRAA